MVHISVYRLGGSLCLETDVNPETKLSTLKEQLYDRFCIPPILQDLVLDSTVLDDDAVCTHVCKDVADQHVNLSLTINMNRWQQENPATKLAALREMAARDPEEHSDRSRVLVTTALEDCSQEVRNEAVQILTQTGRSEVTIDSATHRLQHEDASVRARAVDLIIEMVSIRKAWNGNAAISALVHSLCDSSQEVQERAAVALGGLVEQGDNRIIDAMGDLLLSRRDSTYVLRAGLEGLSKIVLYRDEKLITLTSALLDHVDPFVRRWAVEVLSKVSDVGDRLAISAVIVHFEHPDDDVRIAADVALRHIAEVGDKFATDSLCALFTHDDPGVRIAAKVAYRHFAR